MNPNNFLNQKLHQPDLGLLALRVVFGMLIMLFGVDKLIVGRPMLEGVGKAMGMFGITWQPLFWGLLCALVETIGGLCVVTGIFFRTAALLLFGNMVVAVASMWQDGPDFSAFGAVMGWLMQTALPITFCAIFLGLLFTGPGKYAIQKSGGRSSGAAKS
jgi:putative oxidoreductase